MPLHYILWNFWWNNTFPCHSHSMGSGLSSTENTEYLLRHHSFCLMSSLFDCILLKPLDIMCRGHHQHLGFFQVLIELVVRNTILAPRWFVLSSTTSFDSLPMQAWSCISCFASLGKDMHLLLVYHHTFLSICLFNLMITFSFPFVCLTFLVI